MHCNDHKRVHIDLTYPGPSVANYEEEFFRVFEDAMQPPRSYDKREVAFSKPQLPKDCKDLTSYQGPTALIIPGNHV